MIKTLKITLLSNFFSQGILVLSSPLQVYLFGVEQFGRFSILTFTIALFTTTAALHYELALLSEKDKIKRKSIVGTSNFIVLATSFLVTTGIALYYGINDYTDWLLLLIASISLGVITVITTYHVTDSNHDQINQSKLFYSVSAIVFPPLFYTILSDHADALFYSYSSAHLFHALLLVRSLWKEMSFFPSKEVIRIHRNYPRYSVLGSFVNSIVNNGPVILVGHFYSESLTGVFAVVSKLIQQPIRIISQSGMQVLSSLIAKEADKETFKIVHRTSKILALLVVAVLIGLSILIAFDVALLLSLILALLAQSLSTVSAGIYGSYINYFGLQREELKWTILLLISMLICVLVPYYGSDIYFFCFVMSVVTFGVYQLKVRRLNKLISMRIA